MRNPGNQPPKGCHFFGLYQLHMGSLEVTVRLIQLGISAPDLPQGPTKQHNAGKALPPVV